MPTYNTTTTTSTGHWFDVDITGTQVLSAYPLAPTEYRWVVVDRLTNTGRWEKVEREPKPTHNEYGEISP